VYQAGSLGIDKHKKGDIGMRYKKGIYEQSDIGLYHRRDKQMYLGNRRLRQGYKYDSIHEGSEEPS
jgi:hypothetical protein